jgi:glycosyltransferase involved in cell wall biosynthesis
VSRRNRGSIENKGKAIDLMRVGFDARWYNDSGVGVYVAELLRAMAAAPRSCELIVYENAQNPVPRLEGQCLTRIPVRAAKYSLAGQIELRRRAQEDRLDVFHTPFYAAPLGLTCPMVVTVHDLIPFLLRIYSWPKQAAIKLGYRAAVKRARCVIAVSATTAGDLRRILGVPQQRIATIHNAVSGEFSPAEKMSDELKSLQERYDCRPPYVVVSSARNWRTKNLQGALKALQIATGQTGTKFQTVVYGPPDGMDALGSDGGWGDLDFRRTGYVQRSDLATLFRHARAFLMPSLYEGFGLPILEAMACGCPVITSNVGALLEVAGRGAQVFAPDDSAGMGAAVAKLLTDPDTRRCWQGNALARARDFSWGKTAAETISVYDRMHAQTAAARAS